jgi:hypothetical protein
MPEKNEGKGYFPESTKNIYISFEKKVTVMHKRRLPVNNLVRIW